MTTNPLWHPFSDMGAVDGHRFVLERGEGPWVWDTGGRRYLDGTASLWYANLGHGVPEVAEAVARQLRTLDAYSTFGDYANPPALALAERLAALAEPSMGAGVKVFLGAGGGDAVDTAAKIARAHFALTGQPGRTHLISRRHGYHGTHGFGTSIAGIAANATGWGELVPETSVVPHDDASALEAEIERVGPERVAAFFCEPVIGAGGVRLPPAGYLEEVAAICRRHGVLFVADCVINAFGRLGTWLGIDRWPDARADMVTVAKGITSGMLPVGALLVRGEIAAPFFTGEPGAPMLRHGATYAGHPTCCAAALATLDVYERERIIPRGRELEGALAGVLGAHAGHGLVAEVRAGIGLLGAVELTPEVLAERPDAAMRMQLACREEGVIVRPVGTGVAVSPPLIVGEDELRLIGEAIAAGLRALESVVA